MWEEKKKHTHTTVQGKMKCKKVVMAANFKLYEEKKINNMNKQKKEE